MQSSMSDSPSHFQTRSHSVLGAEQASDTLTETRLYSEKYIIENTKINLFHTLLNELNTRQKKLSPKYFLVYLNQN